MSTMPPPPDGNPYPSGPASGPPPPGYGAPGYGAPGFPPGPVVVRKSNAGKILLWVVLGLFGMCALGGVGLVVLGATVGTTTTTTRSSGFVPPGTGSAAAPGNSSGTESSAPAPVGTTIEVAKDWTVTVVEAQKDADAMLKKANALNTPGTGKQYVAAKVKIVNESSEPESIFTNVQVDLLSPAGSTIEKGFVVLDDQLDVFSELQPGGSATGWVVWEVAKADVSRVVLLAQPTLTLDKKEDQRFFAL